MEVSVLLATTGRPEMAVECLRSILNTKGSHEVQFVVAIDNDPDTLRFVSDVLREEERSISYSEGYRGCSKAWNDALFLATGELIVLAADDLIFHLGWLDAALEKMSELPEGGGLVGFNDTQLDGNELATHYMMTRWFIDNCLGGKVAWDVYKHSFNDCEINERAKRAGRFIYAPEAVVEHRHWIFGTRSQDQTDARALADYTESQAKYTEREAAGFPD